MFHETILTPHYAEFSKIFNLELQKIQEDPISAVKSIIHCLNGRVLILKGSTNIIVTSEGEMLLMNHGTSALATAGSGDGQSQSSTAGDAPPGGLHRCA